ncbi:MAG: helix-turn-helix domain-containing protein [Chloroflexales bacterium]|nr:helix-turn-helix domain-containing protein [Chloroflexales bacterium]
MSSERAVRKEPDQYLTYAEVAQRWKCSKATVRRRVASGALEIIGAGNFVRVTRQSLLEYESASKRRRS